MKSLLIFYLAILLPLAFLFWLGKMGYNASFATGIVCYAFLYRPLTDGYRLIKKGAIKKKELWKMFIPLWGRSRFFTELYTR